MSTKKEITTLDTKISGNLSISDDGKILAVVSLYSELTKVWNVETKELIADIEFDASVYNVDFCPNGRFAYISSYGGDLIYDLKDKKKFNMYSSSMFHTFTENSKFLVHSEENIIKFLDLEKYEVVASLEYSSWRSISGGKLSDNGKYLFVVLNDQIDLYSLKNLYN
jgi:WD40 repeat protein